MPQRSRLLLLATLCGLGAAGAPAHATARVDATRRHADAGGGTPAARQTSLDRFRADYVRAVLAGSPDPVLGYYAADVRLMPEFQKTVVGREPAAAYHRAFAGRFAVGAYRRTATETLDLGARVVEHGVFAMRLTERGTGRAHELRGKYQDIWARRPDGGLLVVTQAWNYDHASAIEEQLRFPAVPAVDVALRPHVPVSGATSFELAALNRLAEVTIAQHDARIWAQFFADDAAFRYSRTPAHAGRAAIDAFLAEHVRGLPVFEQLAIRTDRIDDLGRYVLEYASHIAVVRFGEGSGVNTGKNTVIWRREPGGALKVFRGMAMYD
jgi:ketosteroid isomerase-like protein